MVYNYNDYIRFQTDRNYIQKLIIDCNLKIYQNYWSNNKQQIDYWTNIRNDWQDDLEILEQKIKIFERVNKNYYF